MRKPSPAQRLSVVIALSTAFLLGGASIAQANQGGRVRSSATADQGSRASITGSASMASDGNADLTRTLWYEDIAASAYAQLVAVDTASRAILDDNGDVLGEEQDPLVHITQDAFAQPSETEESIAAVIEAGAKSLGVDVIDIDYVNLFGGIAEVVVEPDDVKGFVSKAGSNVPILLDRLAQDQRPYLVTVVDAEQTPQFVIGYAPGVGGDGQGLAWVTPGLPTDAILGIPVTSDEFEDGADG